MKKFVEIPGKKLKKQKGRFGGDRRHSDAERFESDQNNRLTRRNGKRQLKEAMASGDFELPSS